MATKQFQNAKLKVDHLDLSSDAARSALQSGENISHSLGKIARWYKDIVWSDTKATIDAYGIVKLSDDYKSTSTDTVPTSKTLNDVVQLIKQTGGWNTTYDFNSNIDSDENLQNGQFKVTEHDIDGDIDHYVTIKGLGSAAFTDSDEYATAGHTHLYAGSSTAGGVANSAAKLSDIPAVGIGSETKPVYFSGTTGRPVACTYSLNASVPSGAIFTDEKVKQSPVTTDGSFEVLFAGSTGNTEKTEGVGKTTTLTFNPSTGALSATSFAGNGSGLTSLNATNISSGTLAVDRLPGSAVTVGTYGPAAGGTLSHSGTFDVPDFTVDAKGRITGAHTRTFTLPAQYTHPTHTSKASGLYKITVDSLGHVSGTAAVTKSDIPALDYISSTTTRNPNVVLAGPASGTTAAAPTFRALVVADLPSSGATAGSYGPSANATPGYGATFNVPYITIDAKGRVTGIENKTVKIPASDNTDTKVTQTATTTSAAYEVLFSGTADNTTRTEGARKSNNLLFNPSTGVLQISGTEYGAIEIYRKGSAYGAAIEFYNDATNNTKTKLGSICMKDVDGDIIRYLADDSTTHKICDTKNTSFTRSLSSGTKIGTITIAGTSMDLYCQTNTNTTYSFATGDNNGTFKVTPSGGTATNIAIKGLGSAAYTASSAYATASHTHNYAGSSTAGGPATLIAMARVTKDSKVFPGQNRVKFEEYTAGDSYNLPTNAWYHIISMQGLDTRYGTQIAIGMTANKKMYFRNYNASSWQAWNEISIVGHTHSYLSTTTNYALSSSVGGPAYSVEGSEGTDASFRHVWFSTSNTETRRAYSSKFMFEPSSGILKFNSWYPLDITDNTVDLNSYTDGSGKYGYRRYICRSTGGGNKISNKPCDSPFLLEVFLIRFATASSDYITKQVYHAFNKKTYQRFCTNGTWDSWTELKYTDTNTDTKVTQTATTTQANYEVLFSGTADNTTRTEGARKAAGLLFNPSTVRLQLKGATSATAIYGSTNPAIKFSNSDASQIIELVYTDYDSWIAKASLNLVGNQGNEWFTAPNMSCFDPTNKTHLIQLKSHTIGTTSTVGWGQILVGNSIASGTAGNARGGIVLYDLSAYYVNLVTTDNLTANRTIKFPNANGTISLDGHTHSKIVTEGDNRSVATTPNDYSNAIRFRGLKSKATINDSTDHPISSSYAYLIGLRGWSESGGGDSHELAFSNSVICHRSGATTSWGAWRPIAEYMWANGYWGMFVNGSTSAWVRTTSNGIIPYQSGAAGSGHSSLGNSSWYFSKAYIDTVYGSLSGNASTATTWATARTLTIGSTGKSVNGSANVSWSLSEIGAAASDHGHRWIDNECSANRFAFLKPAGVTIEHSKNSGSSWTTANLTNDQKIDLFTGSQLINIGGYGSSEYATSAYQTRITIDASNVGVYTVIRAFDINISTSGSSGSNVTIQICRVGETTYSTIIDKHSIAGWSGRNFIYFSGFTFGTGSGHARYIRFIFKITGGATSGNHRGLQILSIRGYGGEGWNTNSFMARTGHLYTYDASQNARFPAKVTATKFDGEIIGKSYNELDPTSSSTNVHRLLFYQSNTATTSGSVGSDSYCTYDTIKGVLQSPKFKSGVTEVSDLYMTGNISYKGTKATISMIKFVNNTSDVNGNGIIIGGGGLTVVGSGESGSALVSALSLTGGTEHLYLTADSSMTFYTNCDTIANRKGVTLDTSLNLYPNATGTGSVGHASYKWNTMYANTFYGALSGNASTATTATKSKVVYDVDASSWGDTIGIGYKGAGLTASEATYVACYTSKAMTQTGAGTHHIKDLSFANLKTKIGFEYSTLFSGTAAASITMTSMSGYTRLVVFCKNTSNTSFFTVQLEAVTGYHYHIMAVTPPPAAQSNNKFYGLLFNLSSATALSVSAGKYSTLSSSAALETGPTVHITKVIGYKF